jgi:hypothetical protein
MGDEMPKIYLDVYARGGCLICGKKKREKGTAYADRECWDNLGPEWTNIIHAVKLYEVQLDQDYAAKKLRKLALEVMRG